jgi:cobalt-zinc-cadmium efflux system outer membrane protein
MDDAIARAIEADPSVRAAQAGVDAARGTRRQAGALANPELGVEVENFNGRGDLRGLQGAESTFSISQPLELFGQRRAHISVADRQLHGAELDRALAGLDLVRDVQTAYYEALAANERVAIETERLATAEDLNRSIARRVAAARDPLMAGARAEAGLAEARIALSRATANAETARAKLASYFGVDDGFTLVNADFALPSTEDHEHEAPGDENPQLARLANARDAARATAGLERSLGYQNPTLSFGYRRFEDRNGDGALVAGVSIPLGIFDRNRGNVERARADERRAEFELEAGRRSIAREFAALERAIATDAAAARDTDASVIPEAERALALARDGYNRGAFSYLDVLEAQRALTDARERRIDALTSYHNNEAAIDRLTARFAEAVPGEEIHQ